MIERGGRLAPGTRLGPYEVLSVLGAGGMGEVYRARDPRLGRDVAIKVLPVSAAGEPDRLRRFEREARAAGALGHPNVLAVHDVGVEGDGPYIVSELLEGETLRERLKSGAMPIRSFLDCAAQIGRGLAAAHDKGIVHRDLKPENLFVTSDGHVKILDFGLAKLTVAPSRALESEDRVSTATGVVLGTVGYLSPEQSRGEPADGRSDVFSLGAVLYEMLSGARAFQRDTAVETLNAILKEDPRALPAHVPRGIELVVRRCLEKRPEERFQAARDVVFALEAAATTDASPSAPGRRRLGLPAGILLGIALGALVGALAVFTARRAAVSAESPVRFSITLPEDESVREYGSDSVAVSPDGRWLAYAVDRGSVRRLRLRRLDTLAASEPLGAEQGTNPFFSPDGQWIGFEASGKLKKLALNGGTPQTLAESAAFSGGTWSSDGTIVFAPIFTGGLFQVAANGGPAKRLTTPDVASGERAHVWPEALPDGQAVLFTVWTGRSFDEARIAVLSLSTGQRRTLVEGGYHARYVPTGHIVFGRGGNLLAVPFDSRTLRTNGAPEVVVEGVSGDAGNGAASFGVSRTGLLAYAPGSLRTQPCKVAWVDRAGRPRAVTEIQEPFRGPRLSPDGRTLAVWLERATVDVWSIDLSRGALTRLTLGADDHSPVWSPDGARIAFESSRTGVHNLYVRRADGTGEDVRVTTAERDQYVNDWSRDGHWLAYTQFEPDTGADIGAVRVDAPGESRDVVRTSFSERRPTFSPDGRWLAYVANESGQDEVYVQPFPGPGPKVRISSDGGDEPAWGRDGRELFYRREDAMMAVPVRTSKAFDAGRPAVLFRGDYLYNIVPNRCYDVAADGRFLMVTPPAGEARARQIDVVVGWGSELKRRFAAEGAR